MALRPSLTRVAHKNTALFLCDMQEKFRPMIHAFPAVVANAKRMYEIAKVLDMPVIATEQYPKGLGPTVPELELDRTQVPLYEKMCFSMVLPNVMKHLRSWETKSVILCGIEAHACIYHTTLDLLENGINVAVVVDACSSRSQTERYFAFRQLERAGALITTSECVALSLVRGADHPKFKDVQKLIMESAANTDLLMPKM